MSLLGNYEIISASATRMNDFSPIGQLLEAHYDFIKRCSNPKKLQHFGLLFAEANLLHFNQNKQFQNMVCLL
jgi:hypothetical protein